MAYLQVDPARSAVRLDSPDVRAHMSAAGAPKNREAAPALGRSRGSFGTQIHVLGGSPRPFPAPARDGRSAPRQHPGLGPGEAWTDGPQPRLIADRAYDGDAFRAWRAQRGTGGRHSGPEGAHEPPAPRPGTVPGAQRRETGPSAGSNASAAWPPAMTIRAAVPGFSVLGRGLDRAAILHQHDLIGGMRVRLQKRKEDIMRRIRPWICPRCGTHIPSSGQGTRAQTGDLMRMADLPTALCRHLRSRCRSCPTPAVPLARRVSVGYAAARHHAQPALSFTMSKLI